MPNDDICRTWQSQGGEPAPFSLDELRRKAGKFQSQIARRNVREYVGMLLGAPLFAYGAWHSPLLWMRIGDGLMIAGVAYMAYQLHRRASSSAAPVEMGWTSCLDFHRGELERQRDALRGVWKWYLGPIVPALLTIIAGGCFTAFRRSTRAGMLALGIAALLAVAMWFIGWLNQRAASKLQNQIDELAG